MQPVEVAQAANFVLPNAPDEEHHELGHGGRSVETRVVALGNLAHNVLLQRHGGLALVHPHFIAVDANRFKAQGGFELGAFSAV